MIERKIHVEIENGLHARPAGELVKLVKGFKSEAFLVKEDKKYNLKSILHIMSTSIKENDWIDVSVSGEDEANAISAIQNFFSIH